MQRVKGRSIALTVAFSEQMCQVASTAMHSFITARLERIGAYHEQLASLVGETRATQIVNELAEELLPGENPPG